MKSVIETTAGDAAEAIRRLGLPKDEPIPIVVGSKRSAEQAGMTPAEHDVLLRSLKTDR
ncbi:hypothetical protein [Azospirillum sp. ST 5-10]|uniref:hypothetical protein n=1 Tax=unclassified Azospirillum TaxID=2630922 RepID=UPI003F4A5495